MYSGFSWYEKRVVVLKLNLLQVLKYLKGLEAFFLLSTIINVQE